MELFMSITGQIMNFSDTAMIEKKTGFGGHGFCCLGQLERERELKLDSIGIEMPIANICTKILKSVKYSDMIYEWKNMVYNYLLLDI